MEQKLIDKRKLVEHCFEVVCKLDKQGDNIAADAIKKHILWYLVDVESIDAVPVVRCKDCVHGININNMIACTEFRETIHKPKDFCSLGERKENNA